MLLCGYIIAIATIYTLIHRILKHLMPILPEYYYVVAAPGNDCDSFPCLNGGTCYDLAPSGFTCDCADGFTGDACQTGAYGSCKPVVFVLI